MFCLSVVIQSLSGFLHWHIWFSKLGVDGVGLFYSGFQEVDQSEIYFVSGYFPLYHKYLSMSVLSITFPFFIP